MYQRQNKIVLKCSCEENCALSVILASNLLVNFFCFADMLLRATCDK